jgi:hypothetical protein
MGENGIAIKIIKKGHKELVYYWRMIYACM